MAKPYPPEEVTQAEQQAGGLTHVSVFLARAFAAQAAELAREVPAADTEVGLPPGSDIEQ